MKDACWRVCLGAAIALVGSLAGAATAGADFIGRANLDGSAVQPGFVTLTRWPGLGVDRVAVDRGHIYWTNPAAHTIGRTNLDGSGVERNFITAPLPPRQHGGILEGPYGVAVGGGHIYWQSSEVIPFASGWYYIGRANRDGSGVEPTLVRTGGSSGIAIDSGHMYWSWGGGGYGGIGRANLDGSGAEQNFITTTDVSGIGVDRAHIYWAAVCSNQPCAGGAIGRANLDGSGVQRSFIDGLTAPVSVAVGGEHIYWTDLCSSWREVCSNDRIGRANLDGSGVQRTLITVARTNLRGGLAVDDAHVYWSGTPKPSVLALQVAPRTFTLTGRLVNGRCSPATGANRNRGRCSRPIKLEIRYKLNFPVPVVFTIQRQVAGRLVNGRCAAPTPANRRNPSCTRLIAYAHQRPLYQDGKAGWNSLTFNGIIITSHTTRDRRVISRRHKLTPGSYLLTASISPSNNTTTSFRITP